MGMVGKGLINKLFTTGIVAGTLYFNFFNDLKAQEQVSSCAIFGNKIETTYKKPAEKYIPKYNTTTHYIIKEIQKENAFITEKTLDEIIDKSKGIVGLNYKRDSYKTENAKNLMQKINSEVIEKFLKINEIEKERSCFYKTLTYIAISEANNLPLYAVPLSDHMFVRWDPDGKHVLDQENPANKGDFNWDPNFLEFNSDYAYMFRHPKFINFCNRSIQLYLTNLDGRRLISQAYSEEAKSFIENKDYKKALFLSDKAIEFDPKNFRAYETKSESHLKIGLEDADSINFRLAIENYEKLISFLKGERSFFSLSIAFYALKEYEKAEEYTNKALELNGENPMYLELKYRIHKSWGKNKEAQRDSSDFLRVKRRTIMETFPFLPLTEVYSEGLNEEIVDEWNKKIITRILIKDNKADVYKKIISPWGVSHFKNNVRTSEWSWRETEKK